MINLIDVIKEEYKDANNLRTQEMSGNTFIDCEYNNYPLGNIMRMDKNILRTTDILILREEDSERKDTYKKIVGINEKIARRMGADQINIDIIDNCDAEMLRELGYDVQEYTGVKQLK